MWCPALYVWHPMVFSLWNFSFYDTNLSGVLWFLFSFFFKMTSSSSLKKQKNVIRYPSVSLSPTLSRNEKFEQHIRKKTQTYCLKVLGWRWGHSLVCLALLSHSCLSPWCFPSWIFLTSGIRADGLWWWLTQTITIWSLYRKSS